MPLLLGLVALAVALRFPTLDAQSFWRDEASTVISLRAQGLGGLLDRIADTEGMPPLYFVLAWLWSKVFGVGEVGLRSLSAVIGTLTVPVAYALGRQLGGAGAAARRAGLVAAALAATSPFLVWYSQEARAYALLALLTALATLLFARALDAPRRALLLGWGAAAAAALATHYFAAFVVAPQAAVLVWRIRGAQRRDAFAGVGILAAAVVALAPLVVAQRDGRVDWVSATPLRDRATDVAKHWAAGPFGTPVDVAALVALLLAFAALAFAAPQLRRSWPAAAVAGVAVVAVAGPVVLALLGPDYVLDRYLVGALVPLLAVAAAGFASRRAALAGGVALAVLFTAFTVGIAADDELHREDWRAVAAHVRGEPTAIVVTADGEPPLKVYLPGVRPPAGDAVQRIALVASWRFGKPRPATPPPPAEGFELERRWDLPTATVVRYRSAQPAAIDPGALAQRTLDPSQAPYVLVSAGA